MGESRYARQIALPQIGAQGQQRLLEARVTVLGLGALGSVIASELARAGIGYLRIVDRDYVELSNLQRQLLYTEADASNMLPKAVAAATHLREINSEILVDAHVVDVDAGNIEELIATSDVICDGTDNFETRLLINEACHKLSIPWVYGGALGTKGAVMSFLVEGPCFRCLNPDPLPPGTFGTCATEGVLGATTALVASLEATEALKILLDAPTVSSDFVRFNAWDGSFKRIMTQRDPDCPVCVKGIFEALESEPATDPVTPLCTEGNFQVSPNLSAELEIASFACRLEKIGSVVHNPYLLRFDGEGVSFTLFKDGRAVIRGVADAAAARSIYSHYIGL
jgi:adenylyltransferase/sulfurtransferase